VRTARGWNRAIQSNMARTADESTTSPVTPARAA
jgi:hypothetical protein